MVTRRGGKAYYMISAVAQKYNIHPQTLRLYEREGLLKPSRTEGTLRSVVDSGMSQRSRKAVPRDSLREYTTRTRSRPR